MKYSLLPYLSCLSCHSDFNVTNVTEVRRGSDWDEIMQGILTCTSCREEVAILGGVPRFVNHKRSSANDINTGERFSESWGRFSRLDDRYFKQMFDWLAPVTPDFVRGKVVLEAGCGKGRHSAIMSQVGAKEVISADIGDSVDIAFANVGHLPNVHIIQADIMHLPVKSEFDFAFSIGVIHHMTHPKLGFKSLAKHVRSDGSLAVWVYGRENNWWLLWFVNPVRALTSRLPEKVTAAISWPLAFVVFGLSKFAKFWSAKQKENSVLPGFFYQDYLRYIGAFDFTEVYSIVLDHLIAPVAYYISKEELRSWFDEMGMPDAKLRWHNRNSWNGFSYKNLRNPVDSHVNSSVLAL